MAQTQSELVLTTPRMRYPMTAALFDGRVSIPGVRLEKADVTPVIYDDVPDLREGNFGLADLNIGYLLPALEAGWQITAIPVFTIRGSHYQNIWVRTDRGIESPADLAGKTIATRTFRTAGTIWVRGHLQHQFSVDPYSIRWASQMNEAFPVYDERVQRDPGDSKRKHPLDSLLDGDVDAAIAAIIPPRDRDAWETDPRVEHLFPDYIAQGERLHAETGIVTPSRVIVMSRKTDREHPDLARKLFDAFEEAKSLAYKELYSDGTPGPVLFFHEFVMAQKARYGDPFGYGVAANRATIDEFIHYNLEQGLIRKPLSYEDVFASATLDT